MAISVATKSQNKVPVQYHRIAMVNVQVNQQITILVMSYVDEEDRQYEKDYEAGKIEQPEFPFSDGEYISIPWKDCSEFLTGDIITNAYTWLKKQPKYEGYINV